MSVEEKVKSIIVEQLGVDANEVTQEASFVDDLGADSLDTVELVMAFEEAFNIEIPDEAAEKIQKVKDAVEYIEKHSPQNRFAMPRPSNSRRVAVTGLGLVSPLAIGNSANWSALVAGKSGIGPITRFDASRFSSRIAGEVRGFDPARYIEKKEIKKMDLFIQYAMAAAQFAMGDSELPVTHASREPIAVVV